MKSAYAFILIAALAAFSFFAGRDTKHVDPTLEIQYQNVVDTVHHYDTLFRTDTIRLRRTVAKADTVRDTVYAYLARVDSLTQADTLVPLPLVRGLAQACKDAVLSDSEALAAYRKALTDCSIARQYADSGRVIAEQRSASIGKASLWRGRQQGVAVGALAILGLFFLAR